MRGLTHRAVDRAAGVAEGSTSYYFRTREALLAALLDHLAALSATDIDTADIDTVKIDTGRTEDLDAVAGLIEHWATAGRDRMIARFELTLEATRRPQLRHALDQLGGRFRSMAEELLAARRVPDHTRRAANLVAHIDGLLFDQIAGAGPVRSRDDLRDALIPLFAAALADQEL